MVEKPGLEPRSHGPKPQILTIILLLEFCSPKGTRTPKAMPTVFKTVTFTSFVTGPLFLPAMSKIFKLKNKTPNLF